MTNSWWKKLKLRLLPGYLLVSAILLTMSVLGQMRLLNEVGHTFGGFIWALDAETGSFCLRGSRPVRLFRRALLSEYK